MEAAFYCNDTPFVDQVWLPLATFWNGHVKLIGFESDVTAANFVTQGSLRSLSAFDHSGRRGIEYLVKVSRDFLSFLSALRFDLYASALRLRLFPDVLESSQVLLAPRIHSCDSWHLRI